MKLYIPFNHNLNQKLLEENFFLVESIDNADFILAQSTLPSINIPLEKVIYIAVEPPLADHRLFCYSKFDEFHTVITHNPNPKKDNQFPFTDSNEPQYYPTRPDPSCIPQYTRKDTKLGDRGVFYAGMIGQYEDCKNVFGGINLTKVRRVLGEHFSKNPASKIIGIGWDNQTTKVGNWRIDKSNQIKDSNCDFVLALENTMLPNYLYEKIWDGFASDRVTLYLGTPNIEKHIPLNCFVSLLPFFNKVTGEIDCEGISKLLNSMSQKQYDDILSNARKFRKTTKGRHQELQNKLTSFIVDRIQNE